MKSLLLIALVVPLIAGCSDEWSDDETSQFYVDCSEIMGMKYANADDACVCLRGKYMEAKIDYDAAFTEAFESVEILSAKLEECGAVAN